MADFFDMQDEIVARLATQLGTALIAAEARRAERTPNPDAFDLYLQGMAWLDKGPRPVNVAQSRAFFGRALAIEPDNVDALIGSAGADFWEAINSERSERAARFASAEASLLKALSAAPDNAMAHMWLSFVRINSNRAAQGIADAERALALNRNLPRALVAMGLAKLMVGRAEETEGYLQEALNLSPRDPARLQLDVHGRHGQNPPRCLRESSEMAQPVGRSQPKLSDAPTSFSPPLSASSDMSMKLKPRSGPDSCSTRPSRSGAFETAW